MLKERKCRQDARGFERQGENVARAGSLYLGCKGRRILAALILLVFAMGTGACAQLGANRPQAEGLPTMGGAVPSTWQEYHVEELGLTMNYPETWEVGVEVVEPPLGGIVEFVDAAEVEDIKSSIIVEVFPNTDPGIPSEMDTGSSEGILTFLSGQIETVGEFELGDIYTRQISGHEAALRSYASRVEGDSNEGFILVLAAQDDIWLITGIALEPEINAANASIYGDMLKSILIEE